MTLRDLDGKQAKLCLQVHDFVRRDLEIDLHGASLLIALSGGADSMALLHIFLALRDFLNVRLTAAHLDHGLRPESAAEAKTLAGLCAALHIPFLARRCDVAALAIAQKSGLEETGRKQRYAFLEEARQQSDADWILTAHHTGDLAEDIVLRLIRGVSWPALGGMPGRRGTVLRPLLFLEKERLLAFLRSLDVSWLEDRSNQSRDFRRNRVRLDVLPLFLNENPNFYEAARNLWRSARLDERHWQEQAEGVAQRTDQGVLLPRDKLERMQAAGRLRAYVMAIRQLGQGQARSGVLRRLDEAFLARNHGKLFQFPGNIHASLEKKGIVFRCGPGQCGGQP